jgi:hypothetical protein
MDVDEGSPRLECRVSGFDLLLRSDRTAGLSFLRGTDPVIATAMMIGLIFQYVCLAMDLPGCGAS